MRTSLILTTYIKTFYRRQIINKTPMIESDCTPQPFPSSLEKEIRKSATNNHREIKGVNLSIK